MYSDPYPDLSPQQQSQSLAQRIFNQHDAKTCWTVSEVSAWLTQVIRLDMPNPFWICGELVLTAKQAATGHLYASLRDETGATLPLVYFNGMQAIRKDNINSGDKVFAYGHLDIYPQRCNVQFMASRIKRVGDTGTLTELLRKTLAKLAAEGLTDPARKKPLPRYPRRIGLVTSPTAAGYRDFLYTCLSRVQNLTFLLAPSKVQGNTAPAEMIDAIRLLDEYGKCDLIVVTRGGGGAEDLWCFNDEALARAIASAKTPIVTAVGHERDTTLVDYVSDLNAITPTKAAEIVTQELYLATQTLQSHSQRIVRAITWYRQNLRYRLDQCLNARHLTHPQEIISDRKIRLANDELRLASALPHRAKILRSKLDYLWQKLLNAHATKLQQTRTRLTALDTAMRTLDPKGVLQRGYSILLDDNQHAIRDAADAPPGTHLTALLQNGNLDLKVVKKNPVPTGNESIELSLL